MKHYACAVILGLSLFALVTCPLPLMADAPFEEGITLITTDDLKSALDGKRELDLINTLSPIEFQNRAIPGSINIPYEYLVDGRAELTAEKNRMLVFYCKGPQ